MADGSACLDLFFFFFLRFLMAEKGNQAADMQGQQGATSAQVQQDASSTNQQRVEGTSRGNQQRIEGTSRESQQRVEITLESLKTVMRCVAKEMFDEGRSQQQQQQPESLPSGGTTGKRKLRAG